MIKYLYVEYFKWSVASLDNDVFLEVREEYTLKSKDVYKATMRNEDGAYFIRLNDRDSIILHKLESEGNDYPYISKIREITKDNLLHLPLTEENIDKLINLMEPNLPEKIYKSINSAIENMRDEKKDYLSKASMMLDQLFDINTIHADIVHQLIIRLIDYNLDKVEDPASRLELDKDRGLSVNIAQALRVLSIYSSTDRKINENIDDLFNSILPTIREVERRIINNI